MDEPPLRRRLGCWGWLWIAIGCLGAVAGGGMIWLSSSGDLDAEVERATALGLPMTWAGLGLARPPGTDTEIINRAGKVADRAKYFEGKGTYSFATPFFPAPPELAAWQAAGGSGVDDELDRLVGQLTGTSTWGVDATRLAQAQATGDAETICRLMRDNRGSLQTVLSQRSVAGLDDSRHVAGLLFRLATTPASLSMYAHMSSQRIAQLWIAHALRHRDRLDTRELAVQARRLAEMLDAAMAQGIACEPVFLNTTLRLPAARLARTLGVYLPRIMENELGLNVLFRSGRSRLLERAIDTAAWCRAHGLPRTCADVVLASPTLPPLSAATFFREVLSTRISDQNVTSGVRTTAEHYVLMNHLKTTTNLRLLAADLEGTPWPIDPGDPAGGPLREIHRGGRMISAYSVGEDGRDDGGSVRADWCFALRERLGSPKASDPPPKP